MQQAALYIGVTASIVVAVGATGFVLAFIFGRKKRDVTFKDSAAKVPLRVVDRNLISPDTMMLKLALTSQHQIPGVPVGNHVYISARINGEMVVRPYTPTSPIDQQGYLDFVIKVYMANKNPSFPDGGKMSQYLYNIPINHYVDVRGPAGNLHYKGNGEFAIKPDNQSPPVTQIYKKVNMICGGSGITPMYQLIQHVLNSKKDKLKLALLYANNSEKDILLRSELEAFKDDYPQHFRLWYTLTEAPSNWQYSTGYVDEAMISNQLYPPAEDTLVLLCGPTPMVEFACLPNLAKLNFARDRIYIY